MALYETDSKEAKKLDKIIKRLKIAVKADEGIRDKGIEALKFLNGDQWDAGEKRRRSTSGRPALQVNVLPKFVDQVVGDGRHNRPRCKVRPASDGAAIGVANIREGLISDIEYASNAEAIYDSALEMAVSSGYGAWRVCTRYCEDNPFQQECYLEYIENPFLVYLDPSTKDPAGMGAKWGFALSKLSKDEFEDEYPDAVYPQDALKTGRGLSDEHWYEEGLVTVAEYYEVIEEDVDMVLLDNGAVIKKDDLADYIKDWRKKHAPKPPAMPAMPGQMGQPPMGAPQPPQPVPGQMMPQGAPMGQPKPPMGAPPMGAPQGAPPMGQPKPQMMPPGGAPPMGGQHAPMMPPSMVPGLGLQQPKPPQPPKVVEKATAKQRKVKQYLCTACEFLNEHGHKGEDFPGKHVPLIQVRGKQRNIEGKRHIRGLIHDAIDTQKLLNYWETSGAEVVALAPKNPWVGTAKMFEGYENDYASANVENFPYLKYNVDPEAPQLKPERQGMPQAPMAIFQQSQRCMDNIKAVIGMYGSDVGESDSAQTGKAIMQRQRPGDIATFVFQDNLARSIKLSGIVLNDMLNEVYDTERDVRVRGNDGTEAFVPINTTLDKAIKKIQGDTTKFGAMNLPKLQEEVIQHGRYAKFNHLGSGRYDIVIATGPSYATARQESQQNLLTLVQAMPQQMGIAADLVVKNMDFKDAEEMARRLERALPQGMVKPRPGEPPPEPLPPPPQVQLMQAKSQIEQSKLEIQKMKMQQETVKMKHEEIKMQIELTKLEVEKAKAQAELKGDDGHMDKIKALDDMRKSNRQHEIEKEKLALEKDKFAHQRSKDAASFLHNRDMDDARHALDTQKHEHMADQSDIQNSIDFAAISDEGKEQ